MTEGRGFNSQPVISEIGDCLWRLNYLGIITTTTQPCIPQGSLYRVPALAGAKAAKSLLPSGVIPR